MTERIFYHVHPDGSLCTWSTMSQRYYDAEGKWCRESIGMTPRVVKSDDDGGSGQAA